MAEIKRLQIIDRGINEFKTIYEKYRQLVQKNSKTIKQLFYTFIHDCKNLIVLYTQYDLDRDAVQFITQMMSQISTLRKGEMIDVSKQHLVIKYKKFITETKASDAFAKYEKSFKLFNGVISTHTNGEYMDVFTTNDLSRVKFGFNEYSHIDMNLLNSIFDKTYTNCYEFDFS